MAKRNTSSSRTVTISVPVSFFVEASEPHEIFSLCGFFPIYGSTHLMGIATADRNLQEQNLHTGLFLAGDRHTWDVICGHESSTAGRFRCRSD